LDIDMRRLLPSVWAFLTLLNSLQLI